MFHFLVTSDINLIKQAMKAPRCNMDVLNLDHTSMVVRRLAFLAIFRVAERFRA